MSDSPVVRRDPELAPEFRKDRREEEFLRSLNDALAPLESSWHQQVDAGEPALFVIGVPRSGTTLLTQVLCDSWDVGYPDHLVAAFWRAPVTGVLLSRKVLRERPRTSYESRFGRTDSVYEPHEFGYFWFERLGYEEPIEKSASERAAIDWPGLVHTLRNMIVAFGRPAVFKAFFLGWHTTDILQVMPEACFAWMRRAPFETAMSLLRLRRGLLGNENEWASLRPIGWERFRERPVAEQIAAQVYLVERSIAREVEGARVAAEAEGRESPIAILEYPDFCADPAAALVRIRSLPGLRGVSARAEPPASFDQRGTTDREMEADVRRALARWYGDEADLEAVAPLELLTRDESETNA